MNTEKRLLVTIDGPAGVGKSTLARRVAEALGIACLDTGAMFRIIAKELGGNALELDDEDLGARLKALSFSLSGSGADTVLACNGTPAGQEIRSERIGYLASRFAEKSAVRGYLKSAQRALGAEFSLVAEGRDMGSTIFPDAPYKFFLDAAPLVRAQRRMLQLQAAGETPDLEELAEQIRRRDELDRNRAIAPLKAAGDAIIIDTGTLDIDGVFRAIMSRIPAPPAT